MFANWDPDQDPEALEEEAQQQQQQEDDGLPFACFICREAWAEDSVGSHGGKGRSPARDPSRAVQCLESLAPIACPGPGQDGLQPLLP